MAGHDRGERLFAEQVRQLYRLSRPAYLGTLFNASIIVFALWGVVSSTWLGLWLCAMFTVTGARYLLYRAYFGARAPDVEARRWAEHFAVGAGAAGLLWGAAGSVLFPATSLPLQILVIFLIGGMCVAALVLLAPLPRAFLAFALPAAGLATATVLSQGTAVHLYMGAMMAVFVAVLLGTLPAIARMMRETLVARFENVDLVEQLSRTNSELSERVAAQQRAEEVLRQTTEKFEALIDASPLAIILRDAEGRVEKWNPAAEQLFGWTEREVIGREAPLLPAGQEEDRQRTRELILSGKSLSGLELVRVRKDGVPISVSISAAPVHDAAGRAIGYLTIVTDVTERRRAEQRRNMETAVTRLLAEARSIEEVMPRVIRAMCESLGYAYGARWALDPKERVLACAETWCEGTPELRAFDAYNRPRKQTSVPGHRGLIHRVWESNGPIWVVDLSREVGVRRGEAALAAGLRTAFAFPILIGENFYGVMEFFGLEPQPRDDRMLELAQTVGVQIGQFIARKQAETNLQFFASHDPLTGLFNRTMFNERLQQALAQASRFERSLALLFIDLDGFKVINDTYGHNSGDAVLADLASRLRATLREGDVIGRMGGDEFVVLIEEFDEATQVAEVAKKVLDATTRPFLLPGRECSLTASLGISIYPDDGKDAQALLKSADIAMYLVKQQGKNSFRFYSPQMNVHMMERLSLESGLRRAIERGELNLLYQPRVGVSDGQVRAVEALIRWQHPSQGVISPSEFVPVAEDAGLISAIGEWVLHTACRQARAWRDQGLLELRVAVNLSPRQFLQESLIHVVREALHHTGMDPARLELEITEEMLIRNPERAERLLGQFKELGVRVVIDDFGTGLSSLNVIQRLPIDCVKIDRSLILDLPGSERAAAITRGVVAMAHSLGISTTAEGVETREQREFLAQIGCEDMQGNYFSAPVGADTVAGIVRQPQAAGRRASVQALRPRRDENGVDP